jgi:hypothetical protein
MAGPGFPIAPSVLQDRAICDVWCGQGLSSTSLTKSRVIERIGVAGDSTSGKAARIIRRNEDFPAVAQQRKEFGRIRQDQFRRLPRMPGRPATR